MSHRRLVLTLVLTGALAGWAAPRATLAETGAAIQIEKAWARRVDRAPLGPGTAAASWNSAVYMTLSNRGAVGDAIVGASSDAARSVGLHEVKHVEGVTSIRPVAKLTVPAGGRLEMKPGGYHVMLLGLTRDLKPGDTVTLTLILEKAGPITVTAPVQ